MAEPKPCAGPVWAKHCCEYHAIHSDDELEARIAHLEVLLDTARDAATVAVQCSAELEAELRKLWRTADRELATLAESGLVVPELAAELERLRERVR